MNIFIVSAVIGGILELAGFLFAVYNMAKFGKDVNQFITGQSKDLGTSDRFGNHFKAVAMCGVGSFILLMTAIAYLIHRYC